MITSLVALKNIFEHRALKLVLFFLVLCLHVLLLWSVVAQSPSVIWPLHYNTVYGMGRAEDFNAVYHAAINIHNGLSPYLKKPDDITPYFEPFRYLPIVAIVAQGMLFLSPHVAYLAWVAILEFLLAFLAYGFYRRIQTPVVREIVVLLLLVNSPYLLEVHMGQFTFATIALCALTMLFSIGSLFYVLAVLLKVFPLVMIPAFIRQRRYWFHGILAILSLVVFSVPYFVQNPSTWAVFFNRNFNPPGGFGSGNYGFVQLLYLIGNDFAPNFFIPHRLIIFIYFRVLLFLLVTYIVLLSKERSVIIGSCALILTHFVTYQQVWEHHMSAVLVIAALLIVAWKGQKWFTGIGLASMLLLALPTPFALFDVSRDSTLLYPELNWPRYVSYIIVLPKVIPTLTLFLASVFALCKDGLESPRTAITNARTFLLKK